MVKIKELLDYTQQLMQVEQFNDYAPNGLQVEGRTNIHKIVTGVTACMALLEAAVAEKADLVLVHHGYFWQNEDQKIVGMKKQRIAFLLKHELNLLAYHLPLDAHPVLGNNVQLGQRLGLTIDGFAGKSNMVAYANLAQPVTVGKFAGHLAQALERQPLVVGNTQQLIKKVAWCTGAAQGYINTALELDANLYISGEISEQTTHIATEGGIAYVAAGHHATERYGVQALGAHLAEKFDIQHTFIDIHNPV